MACSDLALEVVDFVGEAEELAGGPDADLAAVGIERDRRLLRVRDHRDANGLGGVVRHLVGTPPALRGDDEGARRELLPPVRGAPRRPPARPQPPPLPPPP